MRLLLTLLVTLAFSQVAIAKTVLKYDYYDVAGKTGHQTIIIDGNNVSSENLQKWNNRVIDLQEKISLNSKSQITSFKVQGTSAFGSPVDESYELTNGVSRWKSTSESGKAGNNGERFYLPLQSAGGFNHVLMNALFESKTKSVDLLPSGTIRAKVVAETTLEQEGKKEHIKLFAISGIAFTPSYEWYDRNGHAFGSYSPCP